MRWDDASNTPSVPFFCRCYTSLSCAFIITPCKRHGSCRRMLVMVACTLFTCFYHLCLVRSGKSSDGCGFEWFVRRVAVSCQPRSSCNILQSPFSFLVTVPVLFQNVSNQTCLKHLWFFLPGTMIDLPRFLRLITCFHQDTCEPLPGCDDGNPRFRELSRLHNLQDVGG